MTRPRELLDAYEEENAANDDHGDLAFAALRAVLDKHYEKGPFESRYCASDCCDWPCLTVRAITHALETP